MGGGGSVCAVRKICALLCKIRSNRLRVFWISITFVLDYVVRRCRSGNAFLEKLGLFALKFLNSHTSSHRCQVRMQREITPPENAPQNMGNSRSTFSYYNTLGVKIQKRRAPFGIWVKSKDTCTIAGLVAGGGGCRSFVACTCSKGALTPWPVFTSTCVCHVVKYCSLHLSLWNCHQELKFGACTQHVSLMVLS